VTLIGPNGAGKTTALKTIIGLLKPFAGEIRFEGQAMGKVSIHKRVELGISLVPEGRGLFPAPCLHLRSPLHSGGFTSAWGIS